jgi:imidazolonepropionase-like amidohydrolase
MTPAELLRAWCIDTPRSIFVGRELGRLAPGGEASFLVLGGDPLADFAQTRNIVRWVKQGRELQPPAIEMPPLTPPS